MHVFTVTRQTAASELAVWELWADVTRRAVWDDSLEWARADGDFVRGTTGELKLKDQPPRKFEIIQCEPPTQYTDRFFLPMGARMDWHHSVFDLGTGNREVTFRVEVRGPTAGLLAPVLRRILETKLPQLWRNSYPWPSKPENVNRRVSPSFSHECRLAH